MVEVFEFGAVGLHVVVDEQARFEGDRVAGGEVKFEGGGLAEGAESCQEEIAPFAGEVAADEEDTNGVRARTGVCSPAGLGRRGRGLIGAEPFAGVHAGRDHGDFFSGDAIIFDQTVFGPGGPGDEVGGALVAELVETVFEVFEPGGIGFVVVLGAEGVVLEGGAVEGDDAGDAFEPVGGEDGGDLGVEEKGVQGGIRFGVQTGSRLGVSSGLAVHIGEEGAGAPASADGPVAFVDGDFGGEAFGFKGGEAPIGPDCGVFGDVGLQVFAVRDVAEGLFDDEADVVHGEGIQRFNDSARQGCGGLGRFLGPEEGEEGGEADDDETA